MRGERRTGRWVGTGNSFGTPEVPGIQTSSHSRAILVRLGVLTEELRGTMMCLGRADQLASNVGRCDCKTNQDIVLATECWGLHQVVVVPMESMEGAFFSGRSPSVCWCAGFSKADGWTRMPQCDSRLPRRGRGPMPCVPRLPSPINHITTPAISFVLTVGKSQAKQCPALPEFRDAGWIR